MSRLASWILFLAIVTGGCGSGDGPPKNPLWFSVNQGPKGWLQTFRDNSYAFSVNRDSGGIVKRGKWDDATASALRDYFTDDNIRTYVQGYQDYTADCRQQGIVIYWGLGPISACWYPTEVSDPATSAMLDYVGNLFNSVANE